MELTEFSCPLFPRSELLDFPAPAPPASSPAEPVERGAVISIWKEIVDYVRGWDKEEKSLLESGGGYENGKLNERNLCAESEFSPEMRDKISGDSNTCRIQSASVNRKKRFCEQAISTLRKSRDSQSADLCNCVETFNANA